MSVSNIDAAFEQARIEMAKRLLRATVFVQQQHMQRVSKPNKLVNGEWVDSSKPGEYPRLRTGYGRSGVVYGPTTPQEIVEGGMKTRVGQSRLSWYMLHLELNRLRLGYLKTAKDLRKFVIALLTGKAPS